MKPLGWPSSPPAPRSARSHGGRIGLGSGSHLAQHLVDGIWQALRNSPPWLRHRRIPVEHLFNKLQRHDAVNINMYYGLIHFDKIGKYEARSHLLHPRRTTSYRHWL